MIEQDVVEEMVKSCLARSNEGARVCEKLISNLVVSPFIDFFVDEAHSGVRAARITRSGGKIQVLAAGKGAR